MNDTVHQSLALQTYELHPFCGYLRNEPQPYVENLIDVVSGMDGQISNAAVKAVARRLKHYIDVERREEGFDSSGPLKPLGDYHASKGLGGTFHYNSLQDKHMQHYFQQPLMRKHLIEMGIAQPGVFYQKSKSRRRSKSAGQISRAKSEGAHLMETSAKVLMEQGPQLHVLMQARARKSSKIGSHSASARASHSSKHSNCSSTTNSGCSTSRRRQRYSVGVSQSDVVLSVNNETSSRSSVVSLKNGEDKEAGESHEHSQLKSSPSSERYQCDGVPQYDTPDAVTDQAPGGCLHQQMTASLHQGLPNPAQGSPSIPTTAAGGGVTNFRSSKPAVIQQSVSVSTVSCHDASTQTPVHAETQTDLSTLFKMAMRQQKRTERESKTLNVKDEASGTRNGSGTINGESTEKTVALSQNETERVQNGSAANGKINAIFTRESKVHTYIHKLAANGDVVKIKEVLAENPTLVSSVNEQGHTPLHVAAIAGKNKVIEVLRLFRAELMSETPTGYTALHYAAMYGNLDCLKTLVSMKCDINYQTIDKQTPLHLAAMSGQLECCQWLVANEANLTAKDNSERTPYNIAKENDHQEIAHYMSKAGPLKARLSGTSVDGGIEQPAIDTRETDSSTNLSSTNLVTESNSHVNVDDEKRSRLSEADLAEDDTHPPLSSSEGEGEDNETADDPYPAHDSNEPQGTDTQLAIPSQANMETEKSDCNLTAASLESNPEAFHDAKLDDDIQDEDPVLDDKSSEHKIERTAPPEAAHEASSGSDTVKLTERQNEDPFSNEVPERSDEHETERSLSPAGQQHRSDSPTHDLREIESFLSNISDVQLSSESTASFGAH